MSKFLSDVLVIKNGDIAVLRELEALEAEYRRRRRLVDVTFAIDYQMGEEMHRELILWWFDEDRHIRAQER